MKRYGKNSVKSVKPKKKAKKTLVNVFFKITSKERKEVEKWLESQKFHKKEEQEFEKLLKKALKEVNYGYAISTIEPSVNRETGKLFFEEGRPVAVQLSCNQLVKMCKDFDPKRGSRMAKLYELIIWYAYRIVKGYWTLEFVTIDSSSGGNYMYADSASQCLETSGARICGHFKDGQGNTYKVVMYKNNFVGVGGYFNTDGLECHVSDVFHIDNPNENLYYGTCVVVLTENIE